MKKRIVSLVLAVCVLLMCVSLSACRTSDAYAVVSAAIEKTQGLDSIAAEMNMEMNMAAEGITMSIPIKVDMKIKGMQSDDPIIGSTISMSMLGESIEMEMYQDSEWTYIVSDGTSYKTSISAEDSEYDYSDDMNDMIQLIPEELLENVTLTTGSDGSQTVTVSVPDEKFAEIYDDFLAGLDTAGIEGADINISEAVVTITVANGYVSVYDMSFKMDMEIEGVSAATDVKASVKYSDPGAEVTITPPEGYQDFEEIALF